MAMMILSRAFLLRLKAIVTTLGQVLDWVLGTAERAERMGREGLVYGRDGQEGWMGKQIMFADYLRVLVYVSRLEVHPLW